MYSVQTKQNVKTAKKKKVNFKQFIPLYIMGLPAMIYIFINNYMPLYGMQLAFRELDYSRSIFKGKFVGLENLWIVRLTFCGIRFLAGVTVRPGGTKELVSNELLQTLNGCSPIELMSDRNLNVKAIARRFVESKKIELSIVALHNLDIRYGETTLD